MLISAVCFGMCHEFSLASISILFLSGAGKHGHVAKWISDFLEKLNSSDSSAHRRDFEATPLQSTLIIIMILLRKGWMETCHENALNNTGN